ncbi:MAG: radical SAM protein [Candidatus Shapirobacteria bacterium]
MLTQVKELTAKTILTPTSLPGCDYVINPYGGCQFACMYCYAAAIARWKHSGQQWGSFLDVKINAPEILKKDLLKLEKKFKSKNFGIIWFSSVTDPYTGLEAKYKLTRQCLQVLLNFGYQGQVALQTKSGLITRDIDLLSQFSDVTVGFTITSQDDTVSRFLEVDAPPVSARISAIKTLTLHQIPTYAFIGPLLPNATSSSKEINQLLDTLQEAGIKEVWFEHINLSPKIKARLFDYLRLTNPSLIKLFDKSGTAQYRQRLTKVINSCLEGRGLKLGLGKVIFHHDLPKAKRV